jgi:palmitoyltransferase
MSCQAHSYVELDALSGAAREHARKKLLAQIFIFGFFFTMFLVSFTLAATTAPARPGPRWKDAHHAKRYAREKKRDGQLRFCSEKHCRSYKPDRVHHCRKMGYCVLRMDHYCPWLNNTIGFNNMKYFFLSLFYGMATLLTFCVCIFWQFREASAAMNNPGRDFAVLFAWFIAALLYVVVTWFFFFHCRLASNNYTTIEHCEKKRAHEQIRMGMMGRTKTVYQSSPFDHGLHNNIREVLGPIMPLWFLPTYCGMRTDGSRYYDPEMRNNHCDIYHPLIREGRSEEDAFLGDTVPQSNLYPQYNAGLCDDGAKLKQRAVKHSHGQA